METQVHTGLHYVVVEGRIVDWDLARKLGDPVALRALRFGSTPQRILVAEQATVARDPQPKAQA